MPNVVLKEMIVLPLMSKYLFIMIFGLLLMGAPVAVALGFASLAVLTIFHPVPFCVIPQMLWSGTESFLLVAVPFFILAGALMESGKISDQLIDFSNAVFGWFKGGLGAVNIVASFIFSGISGSSVADTAAIGSVMIPKMVDNGYQKDYAGAITVIASTLAIVIPPSIPMVVMGAVAEQSIARLLVGGVVPGAMMALAMLFQNYYISKKRNYGAFCKFSLKNVLKVSLKCLPALGAPLIIMGSILTGVVTPTEAGGLAVFYTLFVMFFLLKTLSWETFHKAMLNTGKITASVLFVIAAARLFTFIITFDGLPQLIASGLLQITKNPLVMLFLINLFLIAVGMLVDNVVAIIMLVPILFPIIKTVGIDPIHFGVLFVVNMALGLVTPPFGVCLFSICSISKIKLENLIKATMPLYLSIVMVLVLITVFPKFVLFLPDLLFK
jgi:tripartite ATP-independent transporter DctM subunit